MPLVYSGKVAVLAEATAAANALMDGEQLWEAVLGRPGLFYNTDRATADIVARMRETHAKTKTVVRDWRKWNPLSSTTAMVTEGVPDTIHVNLWRVDRPVASVVNTLVHEFVHVVDYFHDVSPDADFTHDGQYADRPPENSQSAPYFIGDEAEAIFRGGAGLKTLAMLPRDPGHCGTGPARPTR